MDAARRLTPARRDRCLRLLTLQIDRDIAERNMLPGAAHRYAEEYRRVQAQLREEDLYNPEWRMRHAEGPIRGSQVNVNGRDAQTQYNEERSRALAQHFNDNETVRLWNEITQRDAQRVNPDAWMWVEEYSIFMQSSRGGGRTTRTRSQEKKEPKSKTPEPPPESLKPRKINRAIMDE